MIAVSLRQPWAWLAVHGLRQSFRRAEATQHRGELLIHAALAIDEAGYAWCHRHRPANGAQPPAPATITRGGIVGRARLIACIRDGAAWRWVLADPETLPFHRCRGVPGLFDVQMGDLAQ